MYGGIVNYSQIGSAVASGNNSSYMLANLFLLQLQQLDREQQRREEDNEQHMFQSATERRRHAEELHRLQRNGAIQEML